MNHLSVLGKYLDQPRLVGNFSKAVPAILISSGGAYTFYHVQNTPQKEKRKELIKSIAVLTGTITAALLAPKVALKLMKQASHNHNCSHIHSHEHAHEHGAKIDLKKLQKNNFVSR